MRRPIVPVGFVTSMTCAASLLFSSAAGAADADAKTTRLWKAKCSACHGVDGKAQTESGTKLAIPDMTTAAWQKKVSTEEMKKSINEGFKREGKPEGMDPYKDKLTPEQIDVLIAYVRAFGK